MSTPAMTQRNNADDLGELHVIFTAKDASGRLVTVLEPSHLFELVAA